MLQKSGVQLSSLTKMNTRWSVRAIYNLPFSASSDSQTCLRVRALCHYLNKANLSMRCPLSVIFDPAGLKVFGEGDWKVRFHGVSK